MSRLFRDWYDKCTNDYDSLTEGEKKEWQDFLAQQQINEQVEDQVERIAKRLGTSVPYKTKGGKDAHGN